MRADTAFDGRVPGAVYAQPLYWRPPGSGAGLVIVATEENAVVALDAVNGREAWRSNLGPPAKSTLMCANIYPTVGVTGTPAIDERNNALYLDAMVDRGSGPRRLVFGLSLADGAVLPGWPLDVADALGAAGMEFNPLAQGQRGALTTIGERLYVPYGNFGPGCHEYRGWVVGLSLDNKTVFGAWRAATTGGGVWAPGGLAYDGRYLYAATGFGFGDDKWSGQEAVIRLPLDLDWKPTPEDYFAPSDWGTSVALGGANPLPIDLPDGGPLLLALKSGDAAYLLDRNNLGGIDHPLAKQKLEGSYVYSPAAYRSGRDMLAALRIDGSICSGEPKNDGLMALRISAGPPAAIRTEWCTGVNSRAAPIVTTSDSEADPIVWVVGAEGDGRLHAFRGDNGQEIFTSDPLDISPYLLHHFITILAAQGRLYVAGDGRVFAFGVAH
jgi:hypothetical protein